MRKIWKVGVVVLTAFAAAAIIVHKQRSENRPTTTTAVLKFPAVVMFFDSHDRDAECLAVYAAFDSLTKSKQSNLGFFKVEKDADMFTRYRIKVLPTVIRFSADGTERERIEGEGETALRGIRSLANP